MHMKKLVVAFSAIALFALFACNSNSGGMSDKAKKNLENARAISKTFETKDLSKLGDYIDSNVIEHASPDGNQKGLENLKKSFEEMIGAMSDAKMEAVQEMANDDYVFQWLDESWTQTKEAMGMQPGQYNFKVVEVSKFNTDSKVIEHWAFMDFNDMTKMMQIMTAASADTTMTKMN